MTSSESDLPPATIPELDLPIALHKGTRFRTVPLRLSTDHPIARYVSYDHLSPSYHNFALSLSSISIPSSYQEALSNPCWKATMDEEVSALISWDTWDLVSRSTHVTPVTCHWVFTMKYLPDGSTNTYKARLVAKGYTQTYGVDYFETVSLVARFNSVRVLFSVAITRGWLMLQMDIKNAFLYGDLYEEVYMEQPPKYVAQGEKVCKLKKAIYGLK